MRHDTVKECLLARKNDLSKALIFMKPPDGGTPEQYEQLLNARKAVQACLGEQSPTEDSLDKAEHQLALLSSLTEQVQDEIEATFTTVEKKKRVVKSPEEREQARQATIKQQAEAVINKAISVAGDYPMSTTPGRTDCVSHGPDIEIERNIAADVKAIVVGEESKPVNTKVGTLYIHIVPKGGNVYDVTLHRNYCRRYNPKVSPATQTILHVMVGGS